ncbi:hypothetical protein HY486_01415 [Candidatus Woesearchaeota archaeon]|nr:hypothetical protein [Candidatus Woesearchaeota archaeon]
MVTETRQILDKLDSIKSERDYIKERIVDAGIILTDDDIESLNEAENDLKKGKTRKL